MRRPAPHSASEPGSQSPDRGYSGGRRSKDLRATAVQRSRRSRRRSREHTTGRRTLERSRTGGGMSRKLRFRIKREKHSEYAVHAQTRSCSAISSQDDVFQNVLHINSNAAAPVDLTRKKEISHMPLEGSALPKSMSRGSRPSTIQPTTRYELRLLPGMPQAYHLPYPHRRPKTQLPSSRSSCPKRGTARVARLPRAGRYVQAET